MAGREVRVRVLGKPAPQGSKKMVGNGQMVESSPELWPWRAAVSLAAAQKMRDQPPLDGPVEAIYTFWFRRPKGHYGTGRNTGEIKASAPRHPDGPPDMDKLLRSTNDALTDAGVWRDDAQVCFSTESKEYAELNQPTGALIFVREMT